MSTLGLTNLPILDSERIRTRTIRSRRARVRPRDNKIFTASGNRNTAQENLGGIVFGAVLPEQFGPVKPAWTSEQMLLERVLLDAVREYRKYRASETRRGKRLYREVSAWFLSSEDQWPFSFLGICASLNLDASALRKGVLRELFP